MTMCVITAAKSAIRHNVKDRLNEITVPTLLIWGKHDIITPYHVGESFHKLIEKLPQEFNEVLEQFLNKHIS